MIRLIKTIIQATLTGCFERRVGKLAKLTELVKFNRMYSTCIITVLFHEERKWLRKITRCVMFPVARSASTQGNEAAQGSLSNVWEPLIGLYTQ